MIPKATLKLVGLISTFIIAVGCNNNSQDDTSYEVVDFDIAVPDTTQANNIDTLPLSAQNVGGYSAKYWTRALKHCMQSVFINKKDADFLGAGNTLGLGTITDKNFDDTYDKLDQTILTQSEFYNIVDTGKYTSCQFTISGSIDFNALIEGSVDVASDDEVNTAINSMISGRKQITFNINNWRRQGILINRLLKSLNDTTNENKKGYKEALLRKDRIVMKTAFQIKGFSVEINLDREVSLGLRAKLDSNNIKAKVGSLGGNARLSLTNNRTLKISSDEEFIIFGKFGEIKQ